MIELPEALVLANQMTNAIVGNTIVHAEANRSPHKFTFYTGDPATYDARLTGRIIEKAHALGPYVMLDLSDGMTLLLREGVNPRYLEPGAPEPQKHQLLLEFDNGGHLSCSVTMYGSFQIVDTKAQNDDYFIAAYNAPSPLSDAFDQAYFDTLVAATAPSTSAKALLATEQRIPGVGNGVLQDILFNARVNPRAKVVNLDAEDHAALLASLKLTLKEMTTQGGRNVERDLFGNPGGYRCILSAKTWKEPCPSCRGALIRQAFLGGSIYYCPTCQPLS